LSVSLYRTGELLAPHESAIFARLLFVFAGATVVVKPQPAHFDVAFAGDAEATRAARRKINKDKPLVLRALVARLADRTIQPWYKLSQRHRRDEDNAEAVKWFRKAAEQGESPAQFNLGVFYGNGAGVPQNDLQAYIRSSLAAAQGVKAQQQLATS
jgi:TPR repeat protein